MFQRAHLILLLLLGLFQGLQAQHLSIPLRTERGAMQRVERLRSGLNAVMQLSFSGLRVDVDAAPNGQRFATLSLDGAYSGGTEGNPALPVVRRLVGIPHGAKPSVRMVSHRVQEISLRDHGVSQPVSPLQPPQRKGLPPDDVKFAYNPQAYTANAYLLPDNAVSIRVLGAMRGLTIAQVEVRAVNYNPAAGKLLVYNDIDIQIDCETPRGAVAIRSDALASPYFDALWGQMAMFDGVGERSVQTPVRMLVVAHRMFEQVLQPFVRWKQQRGFMVDVAYTDRIGSTADDIKRYVQDVYNSATPQNPAPTFLVIVGDVDQIPASAIGSETERCTDLYYACIDDDYLPDMLYGRMSAQTPEHLQNIIDKIRYYEGYEFVDASYLNRATLIAGADDFWNPIVGQPTLRYATRYYFNPQRGYTSVYEYGVDGDPNNPDAQANYAGCYGAEQLRVGYFNYTAHGSETSWLDPALSTASVLKADNAQMFPFVVANCCFSGDFGYLHDECLGETWIRAPKRGAVTYIGSAPSSFWYNDAYWSMGAFEASNDLVSTDFESSTLGAYDAPFHSDYVSAAGIMFAGNLAVTQAHNADYLLHKPALYYWQAYNVLGDPSLVPYFTEGRPMQVDYQRVVPIGMAALEVHAPTGATVALSSDTALIGVALADANGVATLALPKVNAACQLSLVVTKPQAIPHIGTVRIEPAKGAFVVAIAVEPVAQALFGTSFPVSATLVNVGSEHSGALTVAIGSTDDYVHCFDNHQTIAGIGPGDTVVVPNIATIALAPDIPDGHRAMLRLTLSNADTAWVSLCGLTASAPVLSIEAMEMRSDANSNEVFEAGETARFCVRVRNSGSAMATGVEVSLQAHNDAVSAVGAAFQTVDIAPNSFADVFFDLMADATTEPGTAVRLSAQAQLDSRLDTASLQILVGTPKRVQAGSQQRIVQQYPFYNFRQYGRTQLLLHRHEVSLMPQIITNLQLCVGYVGLLSRLNQLSISVLEVDFDELPSASFADTTGALRVFYASDYDLPNSTGWIDFALADGGFAFSGHRNLLIEIDFGPNASTTMGGHYGIECSETAFRSVVCEGRDLNTIGSNLRTSNLRPNVGIVFADTPPTPYSVEFELRDEQSQPIANALVQLGVAKKLTDANGYVRFGTVSASTMNYAVIHEHFVPQCNTTNVDGNKLVKLTLDRYNLLRFSVTNDIGEPLRGASLSVGNQVYLTDALGQIDVRLADGNYAYEVSFAHHSPAVGNVVLTNDTLDVAVVLVADSRYSLTVSLFDEAGLPIADASVQIDGQTQLTNAHGQAVFVLFGNERYAYSIDAGGSFAPNSGWCDIEHENVDYRVVLQRYRRVQFRVTDGAAPLSGVTVQLDGSEAYSNEHGLVEFAMVGGMYCYAIIRSGYVSVMGSLNVSSDTLIDYPISRRNLLTFVVCSDGQPVSEALVMVNGVMLSTDVNGCASLRLVNDTYSFKVIHADYDAYSGQVELNNADAEVEVQLSESALSANDNRQSNAKFALYPNPTSTGFYVDADAPMLYIYSLNGSLLIQHAIRGKTYVNVSQLPVGLYIVRVGNATAKLVRL